MSQRSCWATRCFRLIGKFPIRVPHDWTPTFLVGCGRSGTTITGQVLQRHRDICVLNEPRYIWRAINPSTDIWYANISPVRESPTRNAPAPEAQFSGKLSMVSSDADAAQVLAARRMFYCRQRMSRRTMLLEKLPINSFRIPYLRALFPQSRFIHLVRNGLEVAHSIQRTGSRWYAPNNGQKWQLLSHVGREQGLTSKFLAACESDLEKGLVEWTLSLESARDALANLPNDDQLEVRYEDLLDAPRQTLAKIEAFLGLETDRSMLEHAQEVIKRRSTTAANLKWPLRRSHRTELAMKTLGYSAITT